MSKRTTNLSFSVPPCETSVSTRLPDSTGLSGFTGFVDDGVNDGVNDGVKCPGTLGLRTRGSASLPMADNAGERTRGSASLPRNDFKQRGSELLPREQMERAADPAHVPDEALVAILLKTGAHGLNVIDLSRRLIEAFGSMKSLVTSDWRALESRIKAWNEAHPDRAIKGVGHVKCLELAAAFEMGRRWMRLAPEEIRNHRVTSPEAAYEVFKTVFTPGDEKEELFVLLLNTKNCPICEPVRLARGTHDFAPAFARDVFKEALKWGAHSLMVAHNHPTGDPTPSKADLDFTRRLIELGRLADIPLKDHLVIGDPLYADGYISIRATSDLEF